MNKENLYKVVYVDLTNDNPTETTFIMTDKEIEHLAQHEACGLMHIESCELIDIQAEIAIINKFLKIESTEDIYDAINLFIDLMPGTVNFGDSVFTIERIFLINNTSHIILSVTNNKLLFQTRCDYDIYMKCIVPAIQGKIDSCVKTLEGVGIYPFGEMQV